MPSTVNIHEAKTRLSQLLQQVERGEEVTIARAGKPVARLVAVKASGKRKLGMLEGKSKLPAWLDEPTSEEIIALFERGDE